jgi:scyllo-inositol 2-dehydrogenase (NADP+)
MDQEAVRVGLIGYGLAGAVFHAPLIASTPGLRLASVVTGNPDRQAQSWLGRPIFTMASVRGYLDGSRWL